VKAKNTKNKKTIRKALIIVGGILVVIVAASLYLGSKGGEIPETPVTVGTVEKMDIVEEVPIKGAIQGSESADITSVLNYEITSILGEEGDRVTEGQIIATLDGGELTDQYKKAQLALSVSKKDYETAKTLYEQGAIARSDYDKAKATYDTDALTVSSFDGLSDTKIKSPISGTVTRVNVTLGRTAKDTENNVPMFVIENLDNLQMKVKISEYDINKIKVGQSAVITADVLGKSSITGIVSKISPTGEQKDASTSEMVIPVVIDIDKGDSNLIAGVTAKATILIEKREQVISVPIEALLEDADTGESFVLVVKEGLISKQVITLGLEGDFNVEVLSGDLKEGDKVILAPNASMTDGMPVTITNAEI